MKIELSAYPAFTLAVEIPNGTVFLHADHSCGPYLRVVGGYVDLKSNYSHDIGDATRYKFNNYKPLPNARLVLE